jgi:hypothetical protein
MGAYPPFPRSEDLTMQTATLPEPENCNCFAVRPAARYVTQLYDLFLAPIGLRVTQFSILAKLKRRAIQPLERDGLIRIGPAPSDRRAKQLHLTKAGEKRLQAGLGARAKAQARFAAGFGARRAAELRTLLRHRRPVHVDGSSHEPVKGPYAPEGHAPSHRCNARVSGFIVTH